MGLNIRLFGITSPVPFTLSYRIGATAGNDSVISTGYTSYSVGAELSNGRYQNSTLRNYNTDPIIFTNAQFDTQYWFKLSYTGETGDVGYIIENIKTNEVETYEKDICCFTGGTSNYVAGPTPTPQPTSTATPIPTATPTPSPSPTSTNVPPTPTPTPTSTGVEPTATPTPTPSSTATPTPTPTETPGDGLCFGYTYTQFEIDNGLPSVRYRNMSDNIVTSAITGLMTVDNLNGTYTAYICAKQGSSYATPVCVDGGMEVTCPNGWIEGANCSSEPTCALPPTATPTATPVGQTSTPTPTPTPGGNCIAWSESLESALQDGCGGFQKSLITITVELRDGSGSPINATEIIDVVWDATYTNELGTTPVTVGAQIAIGYSYGTTTYVPSTYEIGPFSGQCTPESTTLDNNTPTITGSNNGTYGYCP